MQPNSAGWFPRIGQKTVAKQGWMRPNKRNDPDTVIKELFISGEQGFWYDPSDFSTMFQDDAGTIPITAVGQAVGRILDKSGRGNHATQSNLSFKPVLQQDGAGKYYLNFDGLDDFLVTIGNVNLSTTDKVTIWIGLRKSSDAATAEILSSSADPNSTNGSIRINSPLGAASNYYFGGRGITTAGYTLTSFPAPVTNVLSGTLDIAGTTLADEIKPLVNGVTPTLGVNGTVLGTGNFSSQIFYIGCRAGTSLPFNGRLYSMIVRGSATDAEVFTNTEEWVNSKTGAY